MTPLPIAEELLDEARQGSWCPKLCTFACPVVAATGHQEAVPWAFHRAVVDTIEGSDRADSTRLHECSGCLACRDACAFEQDVPAQVLAARAHDPVVTPGAESARAAIGDGRRPDGEDPVVRERTPGAAVTLLAGCHDRGDDLDAATTLLAAAGLTTDVVVPDGCCGATARDLGDRTLAADRQAALREALGDRSPVVVLDPHCIVPDVEPVPLLRLLHERRGDLSFLPTPTTVTVHDPCLAARRDGLTAASRELLVAAGVDVVEPEGAGVDTTCSGAGMELPLVAPLVAGRVGARRASLLGDGEVVTWCRRAQDHLAASGARVTSLWTLLAGRLGTS